MKQRKSSVQDVSIFRHIKSTIDLVFARPIRRGIDFFGRVGFISIVLLIVAGIVFFWTWQNEQWRAYVSAMAGGLGVLLGASAALVNEGERPARWILVIAGGVFTGWFAWYTTADLTSELKARAVIIDNLSGRLELAKSDIIDFVKPLPQDELRRVLTEAGRKLRSRYNDVIKRHSPFSHLAFEQIRDIVQLITAFDSNNGHAHYLLGEIERQIGDSGGGRQRFYAYLEAEKGRTWNGEIGAAACLNAEGFCRERTAWVLHLLANDFFRHGKTLKAAGRAEHEYKLNFLNALKHACSAIVLFPPNGFYDPMQGIATRNLEKLLSNELGEDCQRSEHVEWSR